MCGLVGVFHPDSKTSDEQILIRMRDKMIHRGPDGAGLWFSKDKRCGLAHRRLSIIDLSSNAAQPMSNTAGTVTVTYNGEIYNHKELRYALEQLGKYTWKTDHSDTEVLLHAYEEWGLECLDKLYGMFAFAVYDTRDKNRPILHLARDRMGVKPLYICKTKRGEWLFASEIRSLLEHPEIVPEMDLNAFWHYLTFIVAPAPLTLFRGIFKIPNGHIITIDHTGRAVAKRWWNLVPRLEDTLTEKDISFDEASSLLLKTLRKSIERRMVSDVPFGALLSGGVDSSLIVALMSEIMQRPVRTFTIGYEDYDEYNEFNYAKMISKRYGTEHYESKINSKEALDFLPNLVKLQDEPIADNVCIPLYFLSQLVKSSGTTVVQVGEGADEHFLGYWWCEHYRNKYESFYNNSNKSIWKKWTNKFRKFPLESEEDKWINERKKLNQQLFWGGAVCFWGPIRNQLTPHNTQFQQTVECPVENLLSSNIMDLDSHAVIQNYYSELGKLSEPAVLQMIPYIESKLRLPEHLLMRVDKMTMAHSIEARVPFLDHDVVNLAMTLPIKYKLNNGLGKHIVKKVAEPYIEPNLIYRKKQGFGAPMDKWFMEKQFSNGCLAAFENSHIAREGFLDNNFFKDMLKKQTQGSSNYGFYLWTVMNAVLWHNIWIDKKQDFL